MPDDAMPATDSAPQEKRERLFGWTKLESLIALISVIIAAAGVAISAVTAALTYQQLRMLNNERMTPYRSIFYSSRLESYQGFMSSARRAERAMYDAIPTNFRGTRDGLYYDLPRTRVETIDAANAMLPFLGEFRAQVDRMEVLWPEDIMLHAREAAEEVFWGEECQREIQRMLRNQSTLRRYQEGCEARLNDARNRLRESADRAIVKMRRLIRADQVSTLQDSDR